MERRASNPAMAKRVASPTREDQGDIANRQGGARRGGRSRVSRMPGSRKGNQRVGAAGFLFQHCPELHSLKAEGRK